jgi:hypothetical protein
MKGPSMNSKRQLCARIMLAALASITLLTFATPSLLGAFGRPYLEARLNGSLKSGKVRLTGLHPSWLGTTRLERLEYRDGRGNPTINASGIAWDQGLLRLGWSALWDHVGQGTVDLVAVTLNGRDLRGTDDLADLLREVTALQTIDPEARMTLRIGRLDADVDVYGLSFDRSRGPVVLRVDGETIRAEPFEIGLNGGWIHLAPEVRSGTVISLGAGTKGVGVKVNDTLARHVLAYLCPLLSEVSGTSGTVTVDIDSAEIPLKKDGTQVKAAGRLDFHRVKIVPSSNDLLRSLIVASDRSAARGDRKAPSYAGLIGPLLDGSKSDGAGHTPNLEVLLNGSVEVQIADGRVHQKSLEVPIGPLLLKLKGSVGFDESLDLLASLGVRIQWLSGARAFFTGKRAAAETDHPRPEPQAHLFEIAIKGTSRRPAIGNGDLSSTVRASIEQVAQSISDRIPAWFGRGGDPALANHLRDAALTIGDAVILGAESIVDSDPGAG